MAAGNSDRRPLVANLEHNSVDEAETLDQVLVVAVVDCTTSANQDAEASFSFMKFVKEMTWRKRLTLITAGLVNFTATSLFSIMAPFMPLEADSKGIDGTMVGVIFAAFQLVMFFGSMLFGRFLTTIGARFVYITGTLIAAMCSVLFGILQWCPPGFTFAAMAIAIRIVEGFGCSAAQTASSAIVANEFPDRVATVIGLMESVGGLGFMLGPTIGGALYDLGGFFLPFVTMGTVVFLTGILAAFTLPEIAITPPKDKAEMLRKFMKLPAVIACGISVLICATMMSFFDPVFSNHLASIDEALAKSQTLIGLIFLVIPALYALMSPFVGYLADTFKHQLPLLVMGNVGFIISYIILGPCPLLSFMPPKQLWLTIVSLVIFGFCCSFCFMPVLAIISKYCAEAGLPNDLDMFGLISGFFGFTFNLGAFAGPLIAGAMVQHLGFEWSTSIMALAPLINLVALFAFSIWSCKHQQNQPNTSVQI